MRAKQARALGTWEPADADGVPKPLTVRRKLLASDSILLGERRLTLTSPLQMVIEDFGPYGTVAALVEDSTFSGFGNSEQEAERELLSLIHEDVLFYEATEDANLTSDARRVKAWLRERYRE